jgi:hypothetical protein
MLKKLATWFKDLFSYPPELKEMQRRAMETNKIYQQALDKAKPKKRPRLYKQATVVTKGELPKPKEKKVATKPGLYANIHAKQERIEKQKAAGGKVETMRKPGTKGAPTAAAFKQAAKTAKKAK